MLIVLGNAAPKNSSLGVADATHAAVDGQVPDFHVAITYFIVPPGESLFRETLPTVIGNWAKNHSDMLPAWVASDNDTAAQALADEYGCPIRDLNDAVTEMHRLHAADTQARDDEQAAAHAQHVANLNADALTEAPDGTGRQVPLRIAARMAEKNLSLETLLVGYGVTADELGIDLGQEG